MRSVGVLLAGTLVIVAALAGMKVQSPHEAAERADPTDEFVRAMVLPTPFELRVQRAIVDANRAMYEHARTVVRRSFALQDERNIRAALTRALGIEGDVGWWPVFRYWVERDVHHRPFAIAVVNLGSVGDAASYFNLIADDPAAVFVRALQDARFDDARIALAQVPSQPIETYGEPWLVLLLANEAKARERLDAALGRLERDRDQADIDARIDVLDATMRSGAFDPFDAAVLDLAMSLMDRDLTDAQLGRVLSVIVHIVRDTFVAKPAEIDRSLTFAAAALLARSDDVVAREIAWIDAFDRLEDDGEYDLRHALAVVATNVGPGVHDDAARIRLAAARRLRKLGENERAIALLRPWLESAPRVERSGFSDDTPHHGAVELAEALDLCGRPAEALHWLERAQTDFPFNSHCGLGSDAEDAEIQRSIDALRAKLVAERK